MAAIILRDAEAPPPADFRRHGDNLRRSFATALQQAW